MSFLLHPIAHVQASRPQAQDDHWGGERARITLVPPLTAEALRGLEAFSHIEVIFLFHQVEEAAVVRGARHPRGQARWPEVGIFAQRARHRPNRLGSTICRLIAVQGAALEVAELDAIDGTPVLDIKPVMAEFLPRSPLRQPTWSHELMADYWAGTGEG